MKKRITRQNTRVFQETRSTNSRKPGVTDAAARILSKLPLFSFLLLLLHSLSFNCCFCLNSVLFIFEYLTSLVSLNFLSCNFYWIKKKVSLLLFSFFLSLCCWWIRIYSLIIDCWSRSSDLPMLSLPVQGWSLWWGFSSEVKFSCFSLWGISFDDFKRETLAFLLMLFPLPQEVCGQK